MRPAVLHEFVLELFPELRGWNRHSVRKRSGNADWTTLSLICPLPPTRLSGGWGGWRGIGPSPHDGGNGYHATG